MKQVSITWILQKIININMEKIITWDSFVNERLVENATDELQTLFFLPYDERKELELTLQKLEYTKESLTEGFFQDIKFKLNKWLTEKALRYLITNREKMLPKMLDGLKVLDPTDLTGIEGLEVLYLGGGIDFAPSANEWRVEVENFFGEDCVVRGQSIKDAGKGIKIDKSDYTKPLIFNPLNNEPEREADTVFSKMFQKWKKGELNTLTNNDNWNEWVDEINKEIKTPDLHILNFCDSNLIRYDKVAGDGTKAELQVSDWKGHYMFFWLGEKVGADGKADMYTIKNISPWSLPTATKILRNDEEAWMFLTALKEKFGK